MEKKKNCSIEKCIWIVSVHYHLTKDKSLSMLQCFEAILRKLEEYSADSYRLESTYLRFRRAEIRYTRELINHLEYEE
jgi:hypothetical protein